MTEQEIALDRETRRTACNQEVGDILKKYEFAITAESNLNPNIMIKVNIQLVDQKVYDAPIAQPVEPKVDIEITPVDHGTATV